MDNDYIEPKFYSEKENYNPNEVKQRVKKTDKNQNFFLDYFDSYKLKDENKKESESSKKINFTLDSYSNTIEKIEKEFHNSQFFNKNIDFNFGDFNSVSETGYFEILEKLIYFKANILIYGFGSKIELIYDFLTNFQKKNVILNDINNEDKLNDGDKYEYRHNILIFNCYTNEITIKELLNKIQNFLIDKLEDHGNSLNDFSFVNKSLEEQITRIKTLIIEVRKHDLMQKILIVILNIDCPNFSNKCNQKIISSLISTCDLNLLATTDSLYINYFWNQSIKDSFGFYYLKYNTLIPYYNEINDKNSLIGEKNIKAGIGLNHILTSLTENQRKIIKFLAKYQLEAEDKNKKFLTLSALSELLVENMIVSSTKQAVELLIEPIDHEIIVEKNVEGKNIFKVQLQDEVMEKLVNGDYDNV